MPIGCLSCVPHVAARLSERRPRSVLDLGIGMGFYGAVVRQWLDNGIQPWTTHLVGVEGWEAYRNPLWLLYDEIHVQPIEVFLRRQTGSFDAVLLMDVIEHFDRTEGEKVITEIIDSLSPSGVFLLATPAVWMEQGAAYGNEFERHRSLWKPTDLSALGFSVITDGSPDEFGNQMILACCTREDFRK